MPITQLSSSAEYLAALEAIAPCQPANHFNRARAVGSVISRSSCPLITGLLRTGESKKRSRKAETMRKNKAALHRGNDNSAKVCQSKHEQIIADYERGTWWAGWLLFAMFMLMAFGSAVFGW